MKKIQQMHWIAWENIRDLSLMIECVFHTKKTEYAIIKTASNYTELKKLVADTIHDFMHRAHSAYGIYSPYEVIMNKNGWFDMLRALHKGVSEPMKRNSLCRNCYCNQD